MGTYGYAAYSASKFALVGMAQALQMEVSRGGGGSNSEDGGPAGGGRVLEEVALRTLLTSVTC